MGVEFAGFAALLAGAAFLWTPLLVGAGALIGAAAARVSPTHWAMWGVVAFALFRSVQPPNRAAWMRRRRLAGVITRAFRWEFWPAWIAYIPVALYLIFLAVKHRSATLFTAANQAFDGGGGFVGESKSKILRLLETAQAPVARFAVISAGSPVGQRVATAERFMALHRLGFPIVVKPDVGERGKGVEIIRSVDQLRERFSSDKRKLILQEYVDGAEFGVFCYRSPGEPSGEILSITEKKLPELIDDGRRTLEELILADERAVCLASVYLRNSKTPGQTVISRGISHRLVEVGSHCRGAVFLGCGAAGRIFTPFGISVPKPALEVYKVLIRCRLGCVGGCRAFLDVNRTQTSLRRKRCRIGTTSIVRPCASWETRRRRKTFFKSLFEGLEVVSPVPARH